MHVVSRVRRVARLARAAKKKNMHLWYYGPMVTMPDFGFDGVSLSLAEFMSIFFSPFLKYCVVRNPDTRHRRQHKTAHEQCRVRGTTSWLQRYTRLSLANRAGSNTTRVR